MVRHLVSKRPQDVNAIGGYYGTALHVAVKKGNVDISRLLLEKIQDVNVRGDNGTTPLHLACHYGHIEIVQLILDAVIGRTSSNENAIPPISTPTSRPKPTALFKAILSRYLAPFRSPKASRSDENSKIYMSINTRDSFGQTPLHLACIRENLVIMQLLRSRCGSKLPCLGGLCGRNHVIYDRGW
ncbi:ankyrin repeat-containing domain protein [Lactifluus volemus]|nr:ankyrin repeat-containing domain protein [Lactifluus volemus]